jgi:cell division protein FtsI (penicillin-binding protein 3)
MQSSSTVSLDKSDASAEHGSAVGTITVVGNRKQNLDITSQRLSLALWVIAACFLVVVARLFWLGTAEVDDRIDGRVLNATLASRPAILDRNGIPMAVDIRVPSLFAEPRRIIDVEEAAQAVKSVLPDLDMAWLRLRLTGESGFAWIARELTPQKQAAIMRLGIPGLDFLTETKRFYPAFRQAAHVLGAVNIDNGGIAGIEHHIDKARDLALLHEIGLARDTVLEPVRLSLDMRVQHVLHDELTDAMTRYQAVAAAGAVVDVDSGEILALASLPDFDPNQPSTMLEEGRFNRMTAAKFEPASIFKTISIAGALDAGAIVMADAIDARTPVRFGRHSISDYYGKYRMLSVPEVFVYSSNIGTVRIAERLGPEAFRSFLTRMGFDQTPSIELPEVTTPVVPWTLSNVAAATISFGHGLSVTPIQMLSATAALVNGGYLVPPTLLTRDGAEPSARKARVIDEKTALQMRYLLRLNGLEGSARRASRLAEGYRLGGKTGTAEKVVGGRYSSDKVTTFFSAAFPLDAPRYAMVIMVDEPKPEKSGTGRTSAYNAGDMTGRIVARIAPMLGILPTPWENIPPELVQG